MDSLFVFSALQSLSLDKVIHYILCISHGNGCTGDGIERERERKEEGRIRKYFLKSLMFSSFAQHIFMLCLVLPPQYGLFFYLDTLK